MFKTLFFAFKKIIKLLNAYVLFFTKWMKKYLKFEFVLVKSTQGNLFRWFTQAVNACYNIGDGLLCWTTAQM